MLLSDLIQRQNNSFGVIRLVAAYLVVLDHMFIMATGVVDDTFLGTHHSLGQHAVNVFFLLSGILVAASLERSRTALHFLAARALRLVPGIVVCVAVATLVIGPLFSTLAPAAYFAHPQTWGYVVKTLSLSTGMAHLPGVFDDNPLPGRINVPLWTLKYEVVCYIGLAVVAAVGAWRSGFARAAIALSIVAVYAAGLVWPVIFASSSVFWLVNLTYAFALGAAAYLYRDRVKITGLAVVLSGLVFVLAVGTPLENPVSPVFTGLLALWLSQFRYGPLRGWADRIDLSFGVYIYGWIIQQIVIAVVPGIDGWTALAFVTPMALAVAMMSWLLVEKPALDLRHRVDGWIDRLLSPAEPEPVRLLVTAGGRLAVRFSGRGRMRRPSIGGRGSSGML